MKSKYTRISFHLRRKECVSYYTITPNMCPSKVYIIKSSRKILLDI